MLIALKCIRLAARSAQLWRRRSVAQHDATRRLINNVNRLIRELTIADVSHGEIDRGAQRLIGDAHLVMRLVAWAEPLQDLNRLLLGWLGNDDLRKAPLKCRVLLDVLPILIERGGADALDLAARKRRLQDVRRVNCTLSGASANERVQLINKENGVARGAQLFKHLLQSLFKLAAILCSSDERTHVQRDDALIKEWCRDIALHDALGEAFGNRGLPNAGLSDQRRVVLRATRENLDHALNLALAADHRIKASGASRLGEVNAERVKRWRLCC